MLALNWPSTIDCLGVISCNGNLLLLTLESTILQRPIWQPVQTEETKTESRQCFDQKQVLPERNVIVDMADSESDQSAERTSDGRRSEEPEDSHPKFGPMIPQAQVVQDSSAKETLESSEKDSADQKAGVICSNTLEHTGDAPEADSEGNPFRRWENTVADASWYLEQDQADLRESISTCPTPKRESRRT